MPTQRERAAVNLWYSPASVASVAVAYYSTLGDTPSLLGITDPVPVGQVLGANDPVPIVVNGNTLGYVTIDAVTTQDPRNGDGHIQVNLSNKLDLGIDLTRTMWSVVVSSAEPGRQDLWALDATFSQEPYAETKGTQWLGDSERSIASPATARGVIAVGSYVGRNRFINVFGRERRWENPTIDGEAVVPDLGQAILF